MNRHALQVLQFAETLELVAAHAASELGAAAVRKLEPSAAAARVEDELSRVEQMGSLLRRLEEWRFPPVPDLRAALRKLGIAGSVLEGGDLWAAAELIRAARLTRPVVLRHAEDCPLLAVIAGELAELPREEATLRRAVDETGEMRDTASPELNRLRRSLRGERSRVVAALERFMGALPERIRVADGSVSIRDGRYVIPVRREGRGEVGGVVHDESSSGGTLFVEPPIAVALMNRLRELERAEAREVQRLLRELSDMLRPRAEALSGTLEALVVLDSLHARARYCAAVGGSRPQVLARRGAGYTVVAGRHPLLLASGVEVIPFDLALEPAERTLVVSGPNTGGKTVLLKAVGLLSLLAQAGVIPPVGEGTRLPLFGDVFADIGDEQSIEASLSTFSAHLRNLREILESADETSLVLIDEIGSGTDPVEGGALARAILQELTRRGVFTVATSHLGELKLMAVQESGIVNASLQFDSRELRPTFRLQKGVPGRSYGLAIARRLGLPAELLDEAESALPAREREAGKLLVELEEKEHGLAAALSEAERAQAAVSDLLLRLEERESRLRSQEREAQAKARREARELLLRARGEVDAVIAELREAAAASAAAAGLEEAARTARRRVEQAARQQAEPARAGSGEARRERRATRPEPGEMVRIAATGAAGVLVEIRDERATVEVGGVRLQVPLPDLERVDSSARPARQRPAQWGGWQGPELRASSEVDLRGLRAEEVACILQPAVDAAVSGDLSCLRIIHGKGTGVLRQVVAELLEADARVRALRAGGPGEGGSGVTVAEFR